MSRGTRIIVIGIVILQIIAGSVAYAIDLVPSEKSDETLITRHTRIGGFAGLVLKFSRINEDPAGLMGVRGGLILNRSFILGLEGYGLANEIRINPDDDQPIDFAYGGLFLGYVNSSHKLIHLSLHSLIGGGGLRYRDWYCNGWFDSSNEEDALFVFEPGLDIVLNVTKHFRIGIGGTRRFVQGVDFNGLNNDDLSGPSLALVLQGGFF